MRIRDVVDLLDVVHQVREVDIQVDEPAIAQVEHPAMHDRIAVGHVARLHAIHLDDIDALLLHIQLHQTVVALMLVLNGIEFVLVQPVDIADVAQPWIHQPMVLGQHGGPDASAVVMAADDDVLHLQMADRILDGRRDIEIHADDQIGHVAMDEHLARLQPHQLLDGHTTVRTADVQVGRILRTRQASEIVGVKFLLVLGPFPIVLEYHLVGMAHAGFLGCTRWLP